MRHAIALLFCLASGLLSAQPAANPKPDLPPPLQQAIEQLGLSPTARDSLRALLIAQRSEMFEAVDPWGTPYVYFKSNDYARAEELGRVTGEAGVIKALPWKDPKLKMFYKHDSFQIISAGPDKTFNTEDDVTYFDRE